MPSQTASPMLPIPVVNLTHEDFREFHGAFLYLDSLLSCVVHQWRTGGVAQSSPVLALFDEHTERQLSRCFNILERVETLATEQGWVASSTEPNPVGQTDNSLQPVTTTQKPKFFCVTRSNSRQRGDQVAWYVRPRNISPGHCSIVLADVPGDGLSGASLRHVLEALLRVGNLLTNDEIVDFQRLLESHRPVVPPHQQHAGSTLASAVDVIQDSPRPEGP